MLDLLSPMTTLLAQTSESHAFIEFISRNALFVIGGTIAIIAIISSAITSVVKTIATERTRRDIAAYIAEKSMTPEQGERLMIAGRAKDEE
jgi:predicted ThiF/HesA family dinucleotide-utilizing enzyme